MGVEGVVTTIVHMICMIEEEKSLIRLSLGSQASVLHLPGLELMRQNIHARDLQIC